MEAAYVGLVEEMDSLFAMNPERFPLIVFGGNEAEDKLPAERDTDENRKALPAGEGGKKKLMLMSLIIDMRCMLNLYNLRCIVGVRQVEDVDGLDGRLKKFLDGPPKSSTDLHCSCPSCRCRSYNIGR